MEEINAEGPWQNYYLKNHNITTVNVICQVAAMCKALTRCINPHVRLVLFSLPWVKNQVLKVSSLTRSCSTSRQHRQDSHLGVSDCKPVLVLHWCDILIQITDEFSIHHFYAIPSFEQMSYMLYPKIVPPLRTNQNSPKGKLFFMLPLCHTHSILALSINIIQSMYY